MQGTRDAITIARDTLRAMGDHVEVVNVLTEILDQHGLEDVDARPDGYLTTLMDVIIYG